MKKLFFVLVLSLFSFGIFSLEVSKGELESASATDADKIVFKNYTGPLSIIQTRDQISGIGAYIGENVGKDVTVSGTYSYSPKYKIVHAVSEDEQGKLDADILLLSSNAGVDHINNLRLIISSYLSNAYNYSKTDADTLAVFITVYNAVYRGNMDVFNSKYKENVTWHLEAEKVGLSTNYEDWPGKTQIVIPLSDIAGGLSTIDTTLISDKNVVDSMRETDDKGVDVRKNMLDLKGREADEAEKQAMEAQNQYTESKKEIAKAENELSEEQKSLDELERQLSEDKRNAEENPSDKQSQKKVTETEKAVEQQKMMVEKKAEDVEQAKEKSENLAKTSAEKQKLADKKRVETYEDRGEIVKDQKLVIEEQQQNAAVKNAVYGLKLKNSKTMTSSIVKIDGDTGRQIQESALDVILNRTMFETDGGFICIAGKNSGNGAVKLVLVEKTSMEIAFSSESNIAPDSVLVNEGKNYYAVVQDGSKCKIGKFENDLSQVALTKENVTSSTPIIISGNTLIATDEKGNNIVFDTSNLLSRP